MDLSKYPDVDVLLARLVQGRESGIGQAVGLPAGGSTPIDVGRPFGEEGLRNLAEQLGMQSCDLFLVAGMVNPNDILLFDEEAGRELPRLVRRALSLPPSDGQQLRDLARSLPELPRAVSLRKRRPYERYPPGFGSLFVRMLALRNLGWSSGAQVMYLMSGVSVSPSTIGAVGRGVRKLDTELLNGFAVVLGIPLNVLESLTGLRQTASLIRSPEHSNTAALLCDVRHLNAGQVREVSHLADMLSR
ncbi:hypothetical protein OG373_09890 [Streptomyces avidinii]|uniref:hypothetical protein n=1 Tax=Streptomyces avidinii TaxID=1895 RepID=UPI00386639EA|nr:hypothetical protein OG373_09890 [Streptomyces avidinii]